MINMKKQAKTQRKWAKCNVRKTAKLTHVTAKMSNSRILKIHGTKRHVLAVKMGLTLNFKRSPKPLSKNKLSLLHITQQNLARS